MRNVMTPIEIVWNGPAEFAVHVGAELQWEVSLATSLSTGAMNRLARVLPQSWWQSQFVLNLMSAAARFTLGTGKMNLHGETPNGHRFIANPRRMWLIDSSRASLNGRDLGPPGPLARQARLNDVFIPQRGLFAVAHVSLQTPRRSPDLLRMGDQLEVK
jgi:hypothetical protein